MMLSSIRSSHAIGHHGRRDLCLSPPLRRHCVENGKRVLQFSSVSKSGERNGRIRCEIRRSVRDPILVVRAGLVEAAPAEEERKISRNGRGVVVGKERFMVQRTEMVEGKVMVRMDKGKVVVGCDLEGKWVLHWGVTFPDELQFGSEWDQPPVKIRPPGSVPVKDYAVETPLKKSSSSSSSEGDMLHEVHIDLNLINNPIEAIHFVLREEETGVWYQNNGRNFKIPLVDGLYEDGIAIDVVEKFSIWPPGALNHSTNSDKKTGLVEGDCKEYSILKEEHFVNSVTVSILRSEDTKRNHLLFDTDIPGEVVIHWGVCRDDSSTWQIPRIAHPPRSIVFRKKALQTLLQKKSEGVGSWGLFQLDNDVSGVPFVIKLGRHSYLDNVGNDFFVPLTGERSLKQKTINSEQDAIASEISREDAKETEEIDSAAYTDEIINEIRNLMNDISAEKSMTTRSKESQENILEEIEKLAAEAYSIFRSSAPIFVEETVTDIESLKPSVHICSGTGSGYEILCQGFNWESNKSGRWYSELSEKANELSKLGITTIWLPPPTESVSPEGYMPSDLYNLNSRYGSVEELKNIVSRFHDVGINVLGDVVLNHRCAQYQNKYGIWNIFGGRLNWDDRAIVADDPHFQGRGNKSSGENFHAAPNIDHSQDFVRRDLKEWLCWLRKEVGYDGWRLDFARGFWGGYVKDYMEASQPYFAVGEFWDSLSYTYGQMDHNQDAHRQRIIDWINATNGTAGAFDVTTKGILHEALEKYEYWRLSDERGKPPGVMGWWPSRAVTFIENHDTGSTQGHWRFPAGKEMQGYAYILTHSGTPTVFYDHIYSHYHPEVSRLISLRHRTKIHCRSTVKIVKAERDVYAAEIDEKVAMKIGPGHYEPGSNRRWIVAAEGRDYKVWESQ